MYEASCNCGQLHLTTEVEPMRVSVCHCRACQRRTGSAFGVQVRFDERDVTVSGETKAYTRIGDSGGKVIFHFCPHCGGTVYFMLSGVEGCVVVPGGNFASDDTQTELPWHPKISIYEERACDWVVLNGIEERYD